MELQELAAVVSAQASDLDVYAGFLLHSLDGALPPGYVTMQRRRSLGERLRGKDGRLIGVTVKLGQQTFSLRRAGGEKIECMIFHEVHGIVISRLEVSLQQWSLALVTALKDLSAENAAAAATLTRLTSFAV